MPISARAFGSPFAVGQQVAPIRAAGGNFGGGGQTASGGGSTAGLTAGSQGGRAPTFSGLQSLAGKLGITGLSALAPGLAPALGPLGMAFGLGNLGVQGLNAL